MTNTKQSFYKTEDERLLKSIIDKFYNDEIGGNENAMLDGYEYHAYSEEELIEFIFNEIMNAEEPLQLENSLFAVEPKHIHFIGAKRVKEIVIHRVQFRHNKEGWPW